jgi:ribosomal protein S27AE
MEPMICPKCGATMNHHADKLVDPRTQHEALRWDPMLAGVVQEMHTCPACGANSTRLAA